MQVVFEKIGRYDMFGDPVSFFIAALLTVVFILLLFEGGIKDGGKLILMMVLGVGVPGVLITLLAVFITNQMQ